MAGKPQRRGCLGHLAIAAAAALLGAALWHARQLRLEHRLANVGGEVSYARSATFPAGRFDASTNSTVAREAPKVLDRLLGKIVAVDFGRVADLSEQPPREVVSTLLEVPSVQVVMIEGLPLSDSRLVELGDLPALRQLGLKRTKVTAEGVAALKKKRPDIEILWIDAP